MASVTILTKNMLKRVSESSPYWTLNCCSEPVSYAAMTSGLVIEVFGDSNKVGVDIVLLYVCPQSCMPNPAEGLLEVYGDMVEVLLVHEIFLTEDL